MTWRDNILTSDEQVKEVLADTKRIAVLGIKPETHAGQPAFYVPRYMAEAGYEIVPVPVYYPEVDVILETPVYRSLTEIPGEIDMVNVFRRSHDLNRHTHEILAKKPRSVWFQLGIRNDEVAERLAREGIKVIQDLCLMVEHRSFFRSAATG
ncbi:MAG TPA: CoA-binding protein [Pyrinomonadaceae bacterium]|nr:CoA-binding protein [Pyrinomonadaceae bacterium]